MDIPMNCRECKHKENCHAPYYGGSRCQYEKAIIDNRVKECPTNKQ